jgi:hypothetical protein
MNWIGTWSAWSPLRRRLMGALVATSGAALLTTPWWAPPVLARLSFFRVREVVVDGARYVPTDSIVARLALRPDASVWDDMEPLGPRVLAHAAIEDAMISRELPGRLRVVVRERTPVALAPSRTSRRGGTRPLVAYDGAGTELPIAPARVAIDAPVARSADSTMLSTLDALRREAPQLYRRLASAWRSRSTTIWSCWCRARCRSPGGSTYSPFWMIWRVAACRRESWIFVSRSR